MDTNPMTNEEQFSPKQQRRMRLTWWRYGAIALLILGIGLRLYHLDYKVYWLDEAYTSLRLSGHTRAEFEQTVVTGEVVDLTTLQRYQQPNPDKTLGDTLRSIATEEPQITPLYFVLTYGWVHLFGNSVAAIRSLAVIFSLLTFPCLWWLCRELFSAQTLNWINTAWMAIAIVAIAPLHVLYAQEARPYSLWTLTILLSSAALLWAIRTKTPWHWAIYTCTVALGLYTQLLFALVAIAHALFLFLLNRDRSPQSLDVALELAELDLSRVSPVKNQVSQAGLKQTPTSSQFRPYLFATLSAFLSLLPWLAILASNLDQAQARISSLNESSSLGTVLNQWLVNTGRGLLGIDLGAVNLLLLLGVGYALVVFYRTAPRLAALFVLSLVAVSFLSLALPDLVLGGDRSTRIRYLIPAYLGIQIALAHLFSTQAVALPRGKASWRRGWRVGLGALLSISLVVCLVSAQSRVWWNKSVPRSSYYLPVSRIINQGDRPLVISDRRPIDLLALSYWLVAPVKFQLVTQPQDLSVAPNFEPIFLLNASNKLKKNLAQQGYSLTLRYTDDNAPKPDEDRLWQITKR